jgi:hypothetical protein
MEGEAMNANRRLSKLIHPDLGGSVSSGAASDLPEELFTEETPASELYRAAVPPPIKKHSLAFLQNRRKVRHLAEERLLHLSDELLKLADAVRYHDPFMAEMLDDAWAATDEALALMQDEA